MYRLCSRLSFFAALLFTSRISAMVATPHAVLSTEQYLDTQRTPLPYDSSVRINVTETLQTSAIPVNMTNGNNALGVGCNGNRYGIGLYPRSCLNALRLVPETAATLGFGMRHTAAGSASNIRLPYRWLSRMSFRVISPDKDFTDFYSVLYCSRWLLQCASLPLSTICTGSCKPTGYFPSCGAHI